jgi:hypothetical protein
MAAEVGARAKHFLLKRIQYYSEFINPDLHHCRQHFDHGWESDQVHSRVALPMKALPEMRLARR